MYIKPRSWWIDDRSGKEVLVKKLIGEPFKEVEVHYDVLSSSGERLSSEKCSYKEFLYYNSPKTCSTEDAYEDGFKKGKEFNKDDQKLNYRMGFNAGYESGYKDAYEEMYCPNNERERASQEQAYDEGYDQAIDDLIEAGVIGESDEDCSVDEYSEYEFGDVEDDEEEYCFSKELDRVLNGEFTSNINFDGNNKEEMVNHPKHYNSDLSGVECIEVARYRNFNVGSALKYLWRCGLKNGNSDIQDLEKAAWYLNDEIQRLKGIE